MSNLNSILKRIENVKINENKYELTYDQIINKKETSFNEKEMH